MNDTRRILLAVLGALSAEAFFGAKRMAYPATSIPIDPPVTSPPPPGIAAAEELMLSALKEISEDKRLTLEDIKSKEPRLQTIAQGDLELALKDLIWHYKVEETDGVPPRYSLIRSGGG